MHTRPGILAIRVRPATGGTQMGQTMFQTKKRVQNNKKKRLYFYVSN